MTAVTVSLQDDTAIVTIDNPPVNAAGHAVRAGLMAALAQTEADPAVARVLLCCAGRTFVAGADIREFGQPPQEPMLPDVCDAIEAATKPWTAALHGTALGGGLELALACARRVAVPGARLGLPEVTLGVIPGAGGTVRLPLLIGARPALKIITGGKPVSAEDALALGLIDEITERPVAGPRVPRATPVDETLNWDAEIAAVTVRARGADAPVEAALAVRDALTLPRAEALRTERARFLRLKDGTQSKALRYMFFAEREAAKPPAGEARALNRIGVVGGGTMGAGIAAACLLAGLSVVLAERDRATLNTGLERVDALLDGAAARGKLPEGAKQALSGTIDTNSLADCDLIVEAVFEDLEVKKTVLTDLAKAAPKALLATNTSYLDIDLLAAALPDPSRLIGLHFFAPAHIMRLLEIVRPGAASDTAIATGFALAKRLRKLPVLSGVCDGFIANRIMARYRAEAERLLEEGASPEQIDTAMEDWGFAMGLFKVADLSGLDIGAAMRARRGTPSAIPDRLVAENRLGRKTGGGWYDYPDGKPVPALETARLITEERARLGITPRAISATEIMNRLLAAMQSEAQAVLAEGIARRGSDIDVAMVGGYGFPRHKGGPMFLLEQAG